MRVENEEDATLDVEKCPLEESIYFLFLRVAVHEHHVPLVVFVNFSA